MAHYSLEKWFETIARYVLKAHAECREEVTIVQNGLYPQWQKENISGLAARTTELITVCTSLEIAKSNLRKIVDVEKAIIPTTYVDVKGAAGVTARSER